MTVVRKVSLNRNLAVKKVLLARLKSVELRDDVAMTIGLIGPFMVMIGQN